MLSSVRLLSRRKDKLNLGLDLQGGIHLVLKVETQDAVRAETDKDMEICAARSPTAASPRWRPRAISDTSFDVTGVPAEKDAVLNKAANDYLTSQRWDWSRQGSRTVFNMTALNERAVRNLAVEQAKLTIDNRVNQYGVAEPVIARQGLEGDRIVVQLPGVDDPGARQAADQEHGVSRVPADRVSRRRAVPASRRGTRSSAATAGSLPADIEIMAQDQRDDQGRILGQTLLRVQKRQVITGRDLKSANVSSGQFNQPVVAFHLNADGAQAVR